VERVASAVVLQAEKLGSATALQAEKIASASVLLATQLAASAAAKQAECCCELKSAIHHEAEETRELMNTIDRRHGDRREQDLKIDLSNARQTLTFEHLLDERFERFGRGHGPRPS
jgi:hypothetical protein